MVSFAFVGGCCKTGVVSRKKEQRRDSDVMTAFCGVVTFFEVLAPTCCSTAEVVVTALL